MKKKSLLPQSQTACFFSKRRIKILMNDPTHQSILLFSALCSPITIKQAFRRGTIPDYDINHCKTLKKVVKNFVNSKIITIFAMKNPKTAFSGSDIVYINKFPRIEKLFDSLFNFITLC